MIALAEQAEQAEGGDDNPVNIGLKVVCCCCRCVINLCFEVIEFISSQGFAYMAVSGDSFCESCNNGFLLFLKHCSSFMLTRFFANFFIFLGKVSVVILNGLTVYVFLKYVTGDLEELSALAGGPWMVMFLITYIFVSLFLGIFDQIVQSLMMCYAVDTDINGQAECGPEAFRNFSTERQSILKDTVKDN